MTEVTRQDIENLTAAMVEGFQAMHSRFEEYDERAETAENRAIGMEKNLKEIRQDVDYLRQQGTVHSRALDRIAKSIEHFEVEGSAGTIQLRRAEKRIDVVERKVAALA